MRRLPGCAATMTQWRHACWLGAIALMQLALSLAASSAFAGEPARVVLLTGVDPIQPAALVQIRAVRSILDASAPAGAEVFLDSIDAFRFEDANLTSEFLALMRKKYAHQHIDLVIAFGDRAAAFALKQQAEIWPGTPVLISSVPDGALQGQQLPANFVVVPFRIDVEKTLGIAQALQPAAHHLVVVGGSSDYDTVLVNMAMEAAGRRTGQWKSVERWEGLSLAELQRRLAELDTGTAVVYTTMYRDRAGHRYFPYQLVAPLAKASRAPIYGWYSTYLDNGLTAGALYDFEENGRMTGEAAVEILRRGGDVRGMIIPALASHCAANVSQLDRLGLPVSRLPEDCRLTHYPPSIFREYRGTAFTMLFVLFAQSITIVALLAQRRKRRRAEAEANSRRNELARAARLATVGELSASIAHEVGQPLGAILSNADAADLLVRSSHVDIDELQEILSDVRRDALRANDVVQRLRALLQKQSLQFGAVNLDEVLEQALHLVEPEARRRRVSVEANFALGDVVVMADPVQLQQILLNLAINAMDAMQDTAPEQRVLVIATRPAGTGVEFAVTDRGSGIAAESVTRLFEPFYTTKAHGMGLGLSIVRSIVDAHGGRVTVEPREGGGTIFTVWLPVVKPAHRASDASMSRSTRAACRESG
jgi:signal transduction histidine kinase/ABC-type uncharacterized transport system substrate-binding protein